MHDPIQLRGHLGVPDTVSGPQIVSLNYLALDSTKDIHSKHMSSEIVCVHRYWNSAFLTPSCPLNFDKYADSCWIDF